MNHVNSNHRCEVVRLGEPAKHPNADSLEIFKVFDWDVVSRIGTWKPGDLAAYVVPDSIVDTSRPEFDFIATKGQPGAKYRVTVKRLRGVYSQGLLVPPPAGSVEGQDVKMELGVERYNPVEHASTCGDNEAPPPGSPPVYDLESFRRYGQAMLVEGETVAITEKVHGANARYVWANGRLYCGSRTGWKIEDDKSAWWKAARACPALVEMLKCLPGYVVYGEVFGQVQDLRYGRTGVDFVAFDIMSPNGVFLDYREACSLFDRFGVPKVPELYVGPLDLEAAKLLAEGLSMIAGANHVREGCVVRPIRERMDVRLGRCVLKIVGNGYLERE